ncbi:hypothetical protein EUGRSUZ_E02878 [Eucalyptus grandis]|uniref:Uncharacterized protein n=2 Tax=Eucalyptus grandis TaxID=71139 RepID=A0ACC3KX87_EUCGR|nr:hypothetical protein EUGRSUZ_E02878 [Eucalyptus grandis]
MESQIPPLDSGSSVVSVQELIKETINTVPERYVRHDQEPLILSDNGSTQTSVVPVIDLGKLSSDEIVGDQELQKLHEACKDLGLFQYLPFTRRIALDSYIKETQKLAMQLLSLISKCLDIEINELKELFDDGFQTMRMTYYPPCPRPELVVGLTPHSDANGITILNQINDVDGFQIKKDGVWIPIHILPRAFVVNVGDIMEILSNGVYNSIEHRATVDTTSERISIAMFFNPKLDLEIGPIQSLKTKESPALFRRIKMEKYVKDFFSQNLNGKSYLEKMKLQPEKAFASEEE